MNTASIRNGKSFPFFLPGWLCTDPAALFYPACCFPFYSDSPYLVEQELDSINIPPYCFTYFSEKKGGIAGD